MVDQLFKFPIVMIDGDNEERKLRSKSKYEEILGTEEEGEEEELDLLYGEAEYPHWDFVGVEDRWLPTKDSLEKALNGKFDACIVRFLHVGQLLVPWTKKKFKSEIHKFAEEYETNKTSKEGGRKELKIVNLTPDQLKKILTDGKNPTE